MAALSANSRHISIDKVNVNGVNVTRFFSYKAIVGLRLNDGVAVFTAEKHTPTTSRHIRKFQYEHGGTFLPADKFKALADAVGVGVGEGRAPAPVVVPPTTIS